MILHQIFKDEIKIDYIKKEINIEIHINLGKRKKKVNKILNKKRMMIEIFKIMNKYLSHKI